MAAYTIVRTNGTQLTTIQDGTINTTSSPLSLFGRNSSGYGQGLDTNMIKMLENFAASVPPANALKGQLWFNTTLNTLNICPTDGESNSLAWITLTSTNAGGSATLGNLTVTGNIATNNLSVTHSTSTDVLTVGTSATMSGTFTAATATITAGTIHDFTTANITTGSSTTPGTLTGAWTLLGNSATHGNALVVQSGDIAFPSGSLNGIKCDNYMNSDGSPFNPSGTYGNANVTAHLANSSNQIGNIYAGTVRTGNIVGGGNITGTWVLTSGSTIQATYADLAERFEADTMYDEGTVVELGGDKEVTAVVDELSDRVFGVVSKKAAYIMNSKEGYTDETHPPIALSGRVPVKVIGQVRKGDWLVSAGLGKARSADLNEKNAFNTIGRALSNKTTLGEGTVTAFVSVK